MSNPKQPPILTPAGIASFPWLNRPDTQFKPEGEYKVNLRLKASDPATKELMEKIEARAKEQLADLAAERKAAKKPLSKTKADKPWGPAKDKDKNEIPDMIEIRFKQKAKIKTAKGEMVDLTVPLFDAQGQKLPAATQVWGGSKLKVSFTVIAFSSTDKVGTGVTLRLGAVQVLELVSGGERAANDYGFGKEEGYTAGAAGVSGGEGEGASGDTPEDDIPF